MKAEQAYCVIWWHYEYLLIYINYIFHVDLRWQWIQNYMMNMKIKASKIVVSLSIAEILPGLIHSHPSSENSSFHSKIKVQTLLMSAWFDNALIAKITLGKIIVSHQNDNLALMFLLLTKILILAGPKVQRRIWRKFNYALTKL